MTISGSNIFSYSDFKRYLHLLQEPLAAGMAIIPVFYGFQVKTALQTLAPIPTFSPFKALKAGVKAAPVTGLLIGVQRIGQTSVSSNKESFASAFFSAAFIGVISTPLLAIFTGMTSGKRSIDSLKALSLKQAGASSAVEVGFLASMACIEPLIQVFRAKFGNSKLVDYPAAFVSGAVGGASGHAGDTALTLWQNKQTIQRVAHLARGGAVRSVSLGIFACVYKGVKDLCGISQET